MRSNTCVPHRHNRVFSTSSNQISCQARPAHDRSGSVGAQVEGVEEPARSASGRRKPWLRYAAASASARIRLSRSAAGAAFSASISFGGLWRLASATRDNP